MPSKTELSYTEIISICKGLFIHKTQDYGPSWLIFRLPSLTDQILIKAERIRQLENAEGKSMIPEGVDVEYLGIVNYCVMALIKLWFSDKIPGPDIFSARNEAVDYSLLSELYDEVIKRTKDLMLKKNHDYGESWKKMRLTSITDQIHVKIYRIKTIEDNQGQLLISESIDAHYADILNYCVFASIKLKAQGQNDNGHE